MTVRKALRASSVHHADAPPIWLCVVFLSAFMCAASILAWQPAIADRGLAGLYRPDQAESAYRWTSSRVGIPISGWSGPSIVTLALASGRWPDRPTLVASLNMPEQAPLVFQVADTARRYSALLRPGSRMATLDVPVAQPSQDDARRLGVQWRGVDVTRTGFPLEQLAASLLAACAAALCVYGLAWLARIELAGLALVTALAVVVRVYALARLPAGFFQDEAVGIVDAYSLIRTGRDHYGAFLPLGAFEAFGDWVSPLLTYLQIPAVAALGQTPLAARLPGALGGALAAPVMYLLGRRLRLSEWAALAVGLAMALSPWQVLRTRIASPPALVPLCWSLCLLTGIGFIQHRRRRDAVWFGLAAGLAIYSYPTMKMAVPLFVALVGVLAFGQDVMQRGWRAAWPVIADRARRWWPALIVLAVVWLPFALLTLTNASSAMRASRKFIQADTPAELASTWLGGYATYWQPEFYFLSGDPSNGIAGQGAELWAEAPLALMGLSLLVWRCLRPAANDSRWPWLALAGSLLLAPLPASLMSPNPHLTRAVVAAPLFALLAGMGMQVVVQLLGRTRMHTASGLAACAMLMAISWQGMARFDDYIRAYPALVEGKYHDGLWETVHELVALAPRYDEVWIDDGMAFPYIYVLAAGGVSPTETQATLVVDRPGTTFNTVHAVGRYRFVNLKAVPRAIPTLFATVTSLGNPGYVIQEWNDHGRRVVLMRRMAS